MSSPRRFRTFGRWIIILFCVWHATAVALYSLPPDAKNPLIVSLRNNGMRIFRPYVLLTSQWQQWNLFAPDPLRRVVRYFVEIRIDDRWETFAVLDSRTIAWWRDGDELKMLRRMEEGEEHWNPVRRRYLELFCMERNLTPGTPIRMVYDFHVIPATGSPLPLAWWRDWTPERRSRIGAEAFCPPLPS